MKTVSLELSKQLKEIGYPQQSAYAWYLRKGQFSDKWILRQGRGSKNNEYFASPTADEILEQLPCHFTRNPYILTQSIYRNKKEWVIRYACEYKDAEYQIDESLADAAAKMWLYLKEQKLI